MNSLRKIYRTDAFRIAFWMILVILIILANWALMTGSDFHLLVVSAVGIIFSSTSIYIERLNFKDGDYTEPIYTTRVLRQIALLAISLGLAVLTLILMSGILN
jgi:multisubunit Na+/H+ antiporter MnhB subunit